MPFLRIIVEDTQGGEKMVQRRKKRTVEKKGVLLPVCMICEQTPPRGIAGGIVVSGCFLCTACEKEIVQTRVGDRRYCDIKEKIKKIWHHGVP
jgi:hypothetical protein